MNRAFNNIHNGAKITILKSYWYNGEGWYKTKEFGDILLEITKYVDEPLGDQESDVMSVEDKKDSFIEFDDTASQKSDFFTR